MTDAATSVLRHLVADHGALVKLLALFDELELPRPDPEQPRILLGALHGAVVRIATLAVSLTGIQEGGWHERPCDAIALFLAHTGYDGVAFSPSEDLAERLEPWATPGESDFAALADEVLACLVEGGLIAPHRRP